MGYIFQRSFLKDDVAFFSRFLHRKVRQVLALRHGEAGSVLSVFLQKLFVARMETAEVVAHGLDDIAVIVFNDHG